MTSPPQFQGKSNAITNPWARPFQNRVSENVLEAGAFIWHESLSCVFPVAIFAILAITQAVDLPIPRYDAILVGAVFVQWALVASGLETTEELKVISVFHVIGLGLELFKTHPAIGSWSYPDEAWSKVGGVPLYSGFLYASVASYMVQAWRRMHLRLERQPPLAVALALCLAIYANFFTHHHPAIGDLRWWLMGLVLIVYGRTQVYYRPLRDEHRMPLVLAFALIAAFVWIAENIATILEAYRYPDQVHEWTWVHSSKFSSWFLLVIFSFVLVSWHKERQATRK